MHPSPMLIPHSYAPPTQKYNYQQMGWLFSNIHNAKEAPTILGLSSLAVLVGVKIIKRTHPATVRD